MPDVGLRPECRPSDKLTDEKITYLELVDRGWKQAAAARAVGTSKATANRWGKDPELLGLFREYRSRVEAKVEEEQEYQALLLLGEGEGLTEVAQKIGVSRATVLKWSRRKENAAVLDETIRLNQRAVHSRVVGACWDAVDALRSIVKSPAEDAEIRVKAAVALLKHALPSGGASVTVATQINNGGGDEEKVINVQAYVDESDLTDDDCHAIAEMVFAARERSEGNLIELQPQEASP